MSVKPNKGKNLHGNLEQKRKQALENLAKARAAKMEKMAQKKQKKDDVDSSDSSDSASDEEDFDFVLSKAPTKRKEHKKDKKQKGEPKEDALKQEVTQLKGLMEQLIKREAKRKAKPKRDKIVVVNPAPVPVQVSKANYSDPAIEALRRSLLN